RKPSATCGSFASDSRRTPNSQPPTPNHSQFPTPNRTFLGVGSWKWLGVGSWKLGVDPQINAPRDAASGAYRLPSTVVRSSLHRSPSLYKVRQRTPLRERS